MPNKLLTSKTISPPLTRRDFLKLTALGLGGLSLRPWSRVLSAAAASYSAVGLAEFPQADRLGRACQGSLEVHERPDLDSKLVKILYEDSVVPWLREVVAEKPTYVFNNQKWVEIPDGFVYAPFFQPVRNLPNKPLDTLPQSSLGQGLWVEVTVPYVDIVLENAPSSHSWVEAKTEEGLALRFYYGQVFWVDQIRTTSQGQVQYRVNPNYYGGVDMLWAAAEAFRPLTADDLSPINPDAQDKSIMVDVTYQTLSCYEGNQEVYFCRVSTGAKFDMYGNVVDKWSTPVGQHRVARKFVSLQMSGGTTGAGYDLPGIGWTTIFATGGVAIHSTVWHNNFGDPMSHGCVNALPEDAKWVFRWTTPYVPADPGMIDVGVTREASTPVKVMEG